MVYNTYLRQLIYELLQHMCGDGSFINRLENAANFTFSKLNKEKDLEGLEKETLDNIEFILKWTEYNLVNGKLENEPNELERSEITEKIINIILEIYEIEL